MTAPAAMIIVGMLMADLKWRIFAPTADLEADAVPAGGAAAGVGFAGKLLHISALNPQGETLVMTALIPSRLPPAANVWLSSARSMAAMQSMRALSMPDHAGVHCFHAPC